MADNEFLLELSQNLLECLEDNEFYDVTVEVGSDPYVKVFRAHMMILYYRSPYLRRILSTNKKNDGTLTHIILPNILPESFRVILRPGDTIKETKGNNDYYMMTEGSKEKNNMTEGPKEMDNSFPKWMINV
ncbi:7880_t:CDS:2, partial [Funneliformis geosporum]